MDLLTNDQASLIVSKLMEDIPYNINIMNDAGIIIASGDDKRIGKRHRAAERAIEEEKMIEVYRDTHLEKKGTNEPIIYEDKIIGVVGITGDPDEVRPFTKIVKTVSLLLIEELNVYKQKEQSRAEKKQFLENLIEANGRYTPSLIKEASELYELELGRPVYGIYAEEIEVLRLISYKKEIFEWQGGSVIFVESLDFLERLTETFLIVSGENHDVGRILLEIKQTVAMASFVQMEKTKVIRTHDFYLANLFSFPIPPSFSLLKKVEEMAPEYVETLTSYAKNNMSINDTAQELHIHRNTLNYRIQKIEELTGKNPRLWYELWELFYHFAYYAHNQY